MNLWKRTWIPGMVALALVALVLVPLIAGGDAPKGKRVLVLGFDGMDPRLTKKMMEEGRR